MPCPGREGGASNPSPWGSTEALYPAQEAGARPTSRSRKTSSSRLPQPSLAMVSRIPSMLGWLRHTPSSASLFKYFLFRLTMDSLQGRGLGSGMHHACHSPPCSTRHLLEGLAIIDDGNHILDIAVWVLPILQVLLLIQLGFILVSGNHMTVLVKVTYKLLPGPR